MYKIESDEQIPTLSHNVGIVLDFPLCGIVDTRSMCISSIDHLYTSYKEAEKAADAMNLQEGANVYQVYPLDNHIYTYIP